MIRVIMWGCSDYRSEGKYAQQYGALVLNSVLLISLQLWSVKSGLQFPYIKISLFFLYFFLFFC